MLPSRRPVRTNARCRLRSPRVQRERTRVVRTSAVQSVVVCVGKDSKAWPLAARPSVTAQRLRTQLGRAPGKFLESGFKPAKVDWFRTDWSLIRCSRSVRPIFFSFEMSLLRMPSEPFTDGRRNPPTECWHKPLAGPVNIVQNGPART